MNSQPIIFHGIIIIIIFLLTIIAVLPSKWLIFPFLKLNYLPLITIPLYLVYELTMPSNINIRIDVLIIWPLLIICVVGSSIKIVLRNKRGKP